MPKGTALNAKILTPIAAVAVSLLSTGAMAQSSVTLYGRLDVSVETIRFNGGPTGASKTLNLLSNDGSRLGFRGVEDLGGGMRAIFRLEGAFGPDTGGPNGGFMFGRESVLGISSATAGELMLGRNYSPVDQDAWYFDAFQYGGNAASYLPQRYAARINNSLRYNSPKLGGFQISALYGLPENASGTPAIGRTVAANVSYFSGPLAAKASIQQQKIAAANPSNTNNRNDVLLGLSYNFDFAKISGAYNQRDDDNADVYRSVNLGVNVPVGVGNIRASYTRVTQSSMRSNLVGLGYWHPLSKRTSVYTSFARTTNGANSDLLNFVLPTYTSVSKGESVNAFQVGIRHNF